MFYQEARPTIKSGDQLFWTHKKWNSFYDLKVQAVRLFTQSEYCHIGTAWVIGNRVFVLEAVTPQIRIYPLSKLLPFWLVRVPSYWNDKVEENALSHVGEEYSTWEAILAFLNKIKNGDDAKWECAEYSVDILSSANIVPADTQATPANLMHVLQSKDYPVYWVE